jgi:hypothetical protein
MGCCTANVSCWGVKRTWRFAGGRRITLFVMHGDQDIALRLHDAIRRQLKKGSTEPVFIASEALKDLDKPDGQTDDNETSPTRSAGRNSRLRRALRFATGR